MALNKGLLQHFYVFFSAMIMSNAEQQINLVMGAKTFEDFYDALY